MSAWPVCWLPRFDSAFDEQQQEQPDLVELFTGIYKIRGNFPRVLEIGVLGTLTHYDIWGGNVMVHSWATGLHLSSFLEAIEYLADCARDLSSMCGLGGKRLIEIYAQLRGLDSRYQVQHDIYASKMSR